jgi:hypothetical protein
VSQADEEDLPLAPREQAELLEALEAALRPGELAEDVNERLIESALEDPLAPASEQELIESGRLREALEQGTPHEDAGLLAALGAPFSAPVGDAADDAAARRALEAALGVAPKSERRRGNVTYAVFGASSAILAAAAAALLFLPALSRSSAPAVSAEPGALVKPHSTAPLFMDRFETGDTTARMDLIASARGHDLRDNRYAAWGVR